MIYHPADCDVHFGPCPTDTEVDEMLALNAKLPKLSAAFRPSANERSDEDDRG